jgi:F0F1-type ATP synthase membrane subunit c/vacuolar-type H+-ATPase subunit K
MIFSSTFFLTYGAACLHYGLVALLLLISIIVVSMSLGLVGKKAIAESNAQPIVLSDIRTALFLGAAMIETTAIIGVLTAFFMIMSTQRMLHGPTIYFGLAEIGIVFAICCATLAFGFSCTLPINAACTAIARQPLFAGKINRYMFFSLCLLATPLILAFCVALFICNQAPTITHYSEAIRLISAGVCIGLGSIGPTIGLALLGQAGCNALGINRNSYAPILTYTFISQAFAETPVILALVVAVFILFTATSTLVDSYALLAASICIGFGTLGTAINAGNIAAKVCQSIATNPTETNKVPRFGILSQILVEACAIYAFIIALILIWLH